MAPWTAPAAGRSPRRDLGSGFHGASLTGGRAGDATWSWVAPSPSWAAPSRTWAAGGAGSQVPTRRCTQGVNNARGGSEPPR
eukprot:6368627-Pyramimonas_sp.AAC.1